MDPVAVRHVEIEHVEARLMGAARPGPALDHLRNLVAGERPRRRIGLGALTPLETRVPSPPSPRRQANSERCSALHGRKRRALRPEWPSWRPGTALCWRMKSTQRLRPGM